MSREYIHIPKDLGEVAADVVADGMGSWRFVIIQTVVIIIWTALNAAGWFIWHWDPYPFILLNLVFSTQAAYASPLILMSQNRQARKDRIRDDHEAQEVSDLHAINRRQLDILEAAQTQLQLLEDIKAQLAENATSHP